MATLISSQRYIDEDTVNSKIAAEDFTVQLSPVFEIDGQEYQVVMDGHHSYHAAITAGVAPDFVEQAASDNDKIALIDDVDLFLEVCYHDSDWYDIQTGHNVF